MAANMEWLKTHVFIFLFIGAPFLGIPPALVNTLTCACIFILGILLEELLNRVSQLPETFRTIGNYSYYIFLVHHAIIYACDEALTGQILGRKKMLLLFATEVLAMILCAQALDWICRKIKTAVTGKPAAVITESSVSGAGRHVSGMEEQVPGPEGQKRSTEGNAPGKPEDGTGGDSAPGKQEDGTGGER